MVVYDLSGLWDAVIGDGKMYRIVLPGTLDENGVGSPQKPAASRLTRKHAFKGEARITKRIRFQPPKGKRVFLEAERARCLKLFVDKTWVQPFYPQTLVTPHCFEVTGLLSGESEVAILSDNSYPGLPKKSIEYSSTATDETQTNWNGILGYFHFRVEEPVFVSNIYVYPVRKTEEKKAGACEVSEGKQDQTKRVCGAPDVINVRVELSADREWSGKLYIVSDALKEVAVQEVSVSAGQTDVVFKELALSENVQLWDEYEGNLYELSVQPEGLEAKTVTFGVREFSYNENGRITLNGRTIFLRSEANCAVFPEEGHPPMSVKEWLKVLRTYKSYGVNCVRFHSHCPPEAAFEAADQLGILLQPELSCWNPNDAFLSDEEFSYYQTELKELLKHYANHPSFVMLTFGNELQTTQEGHNRMRTMLETAHKIDKTRLIADGSNNHYGAKGCEEESDFYTAQNYLDKPLRGIFAGMEGYINKQYPNAKTNYNDVLCEIRKSYQKPVFNFEVGQFEVLPDFAQLGSFQGVTLPKNFEMVKERVEQNGLFKDWEQYVKATGELSRLCYREEIEAVFRTKGMSGISLLGLQDFPGQGTALVGMLDSHLMPKPYSFAEPEQFGAFFAESLPLVLLDKYTYQNNETLKADILAANYGKSEIRGILKCTLVGEGITLLEEKEEVCCPAGELTKAGSIKFLLSEFTKAARLNLTVEIGHMKNTYPIWVYPEISLKCPSGVYETTCFDEKAKEVLKQGGTVYLSPDSTKEALPKSVQAQFSTDFWSVGTFSGQEGAMGQLIDCAHPVFAEFPTEFYTNWQWWPMAVQRAVILPKGYKAIVTEMDSYANLRPMAQLFECRCMDGKLLFSSFGLQNILQYPECKALLYSIYKYLSSDKFSPAQEIDPKEIEELVNNTVEIKTK